ncbi:MAG: S-methyl-5'-thioadenosine phosphorylase, partial [Candidatus Omnitrophota bacterium]|nr:S-methyl-5'-thioadenosine phosphorylase [Candidatus Omnitrophota bacterium]
HESVTIDMIIQNLHKNVANAKRLLSAAIKNIEPGRSCACKDALKYAILTDKKLISSKLKKDLNIIIGKYMK